MLRLPKISRLEYIIRNPRFRCAKVKILYIAEFEMINRFNMNTVTTIKVYVTLAFIKTWVSALETRYC